MHKVETPPRPRYLFIGEGGVERNRKGRGGEGAGETRGQFPLENIEPFYVKIEMKALPEFAGCRITWKGFSMKSTIANLATGRTDLWSPFAGHESEDLEGRSGGEGVINI